MRVIEDAWRHGDLPRGAVTTIGNYDGIHRGQQEILRRVVERARTQQRPSAVVTFEPHPLAVLRPERAPRRLTAGPQKERLIAEAGIEAMAIIVFDPDFASTPATEFVDVFLAERLGATEVHVGSRFVFGRRREGDLALLARRGSELGFRAFGLDEVEHAGEPISSTRIRQALAGGDVAAASAMLGRPYALSGLVVEGQRRGRTLGWPTLNLAPEQGQLPADGVYVTGASFGDGPALPAVTNLGMRPTVEGKGARTVETHVLESLSGEHYGREMELLFWARLRGEARFGSLEELVAQIGRDAQAAREYFDAQNC